MKRSTNLAWSELRVGILLLAAFLVGTSAIVFFSGIREYFRPTFPVHTYLTKVSGLKPGAVVMLSGVTVGNVTTLDLAPEKDAVKVSMKIYTALGEAVRENATATLGSQGLLGDKYIELDPGSQELPPIAVDGVIQPNLDALDIDQVMGQAEDVTKKLNDLLDEMTGLAREIREGGGTAGKLLADSGLYDNARKAAAELTDTAKALSETASTYDKLGDKVGKTFLEGDGTLKRLADNPEPFEKLNASLGHMDTVLGRLEEGEGALGKLLNDPEMADEMTGLVQDIRALVTDIKEHPKRYFDVSVF
ncbi:MAG: MlaD family protein [Leptospirillia bacterium]